MNIAQEIPFFSETRWAYRFKAVKAVYENFNDIIEALNIIISNGGFQRMAARELIATLDDPEFVYCLIIFNKLFPFFMLLTKRSNVK